jgi:hypothetical protein
MVARPSVIFCDGTKNFLDGDLLAAALRFNREVDIFVFRMARQRFSCVYPPTHMPVMRLMAQRLRSTPRDQIDGRPP